MPPCYPEEIQTLRSNLKEARQDYQSLEAQLREVRSAETSTKVMRSKLIRNAVLSDFIVVQGRNAQPTPTVGTGRSRAHIQ